ncbi:hypothetical protein [Patulibacter sp. SYSU D01012]|uniref:hypothetical protein n=1 Tax=Patulibacter sp. SYSU D01012 TaxID=2817381 RepID=UPI001B311168|nr:hypothetical protein [Patulibacter sp. SYSU D01012]
MPQRLPLVLALLVGVLAALAPTASAAVDTAKVARALERDGVYVDPLFRDVVSPRQERTFARLAGEASPRTYIALVPLERGDRFDGDPQKLATALQGRLGPKAGAAVYLLRSSNGGLRAQDYSTGRFAYPTKASQAERVAQYEDVDGEQPEWNVRELLQRYFAVLKQPNLAQRAEKAKGGDDDADYDRPAGGRGTSEGSPVGDGGAPVLALVLVAVLVLAAVVGLLARRRGARHADDAMPVLPDRVFEHARAAQRSGLRLDAETELLQLSELLDAQAVPNREAAQDAYQRALDGYTAARRTLNGTDRIVDVVGVLVLVDMARAELARAKDLDAGRKPRVRKALCFFDPLHGRAKRTVGWERGLQVPVCAECAAAMSGRGQLDPLRDGDRPYFEADTVWARTGFGAFDDDLIGRVSRGE